MDELASAAPPVVAAMCGGAVAQLDGDGYDARHEEASASPTPRRGRLALALARVSPRLSDLALTRTLLRPPDLALTRPLHLSPPAATGHVR